MSRRCLYTGAAVVVLIVGGLFMVVFGRRALSWLKDRLSRPLPVTTEIIASDGSYTNVIFLHHSTGQNLIAQGNVRTLFSEKGYQFWDHDYNNKGLTRPDGSLTGTSYDIPEITPGRTAWGNTDPEGLAVLFSQPVHSLPDNAFSRLLQHEVIIVKSCFPNNAIKSDTELEQNKSWYLTMRDAVDQHPDRVFIFLTSPPLHPKATNVDEAARAYTLANWLTSDEFRGGRPNLYVFDFFSQLADSQTHMLRVDYQRSADSSDSHPNAEANRIIGPLFVEFVDQAVRSYRVSR